jgi:hypothetical protein
MTSLKASNLSIDLIADDWDKTETILETHRNSLVSKISNGPLEYSTLISEIKSRHGTLFQPTNNQIVLFFAFDQHKEIFQSAEKNKLLLTERFFQTCEYLGEDGMKEINLQKEISLYEKLRAGFSFRCYNKLCKDCENEIASKMNIFIGSGKNKIRDVLKINEMRIAVTLECETRRDGLIRTHEDKMDSVDLQANSFRSKPSKIPSSLTRLHETSKQNLKREMDSLWNFLSSMLVHPDTWNVVNDRKIFMAEQRREPISTKQ